MRSRRKHLAAMRVAALLVVAGAILIAYQSSRQSANDRLRSQMKDGAIKLFSARFNGNESDRQQVLAWIESVHADVFERVSSEANVNPRAGRSNGNRQIGVELHVFMKVQDYLHALRDELTQVAVRALRSDLVPQIGEALE